MFFAEKQITVVKRETAGSRQIMRFVRGIAYMTLFQFARCVLSEKIYLKGFFVMFIVCLVKIYLTTISKLAMQDVVNNCLIYQNH